MSQPRRLFTTEPPKVTGLSPKEGPPGTKITVRGENLGTSPSDVIGLTICGVDCLMYVEWKSPSKILSRSGRCNGSGDVIVTTKSGGRGTCTVQFRGYEDIVSPTKDSAVWINEDDYFSFGNTRHGTTTSPSLYPQDPLGICLDDTSRNVRINLNESLFRELFPDSKPDENCGSIISHNFIPAWYLLENHSGTSFSDLKLGLNSLKSRVSGRSNSTSVIGPLALLKPNVLEVIECLDALKTVHVMYKKDKQDIGIDLTGKIEDAITKSTSDAHSIFDSVLSRKDLADSTRNALNVLQRYR